jgi:hypothetical protein
MKMASWALSKMAWKIMSSSIYSLRGWFLAYQGDRVHSSGSRRVTLFFLLNSIQQNTPIHVFTKWLGDSAEDVGKRKDFCPQKAGLPLLILHA